MAKQVKKVANKQIEKVENKGKKLSKSELSFKAGDISKKRLYRNNEGNLFDFPVTGSLFIAEGSTFTADHIEQIEALEG